MERITVRWIGTMAAVLGFGTLASAQYANSYSPTIPQAPAVQAQPGQAAPSAQPQPGAQLQPGNQPQPGNQARPGVNQPPGSFPYSQGPGAAGPNGAPAPGAAWPNMPGAFPYAQYGAQTNPSPSVMAHTPIPQTPAPGYNPGPYGTYGAPPQPRGTAFGAGLAPVPYNEFCPQCANGCGSLKSDLGFVFGSCKSFFNPCGPIPCNGGLWNKCPAYPYGRPYAYGYNTCCYDSYANH